MSFLSQLFAKRSSAPVARDRLQILLAHERAEGGGEGQGELIARLREEILEVIARHVPIDRDKVQIKLDRGAGVSTLEIDVEMPVGKKKSETADKRGADKPGADKPGNGRPGADEPRTGKPEAVTPGTAAVGDGAAEDAGAGVAAGKAGTGEPAPKVAS